MSNYSLNKHTFILQKIVWHRNALKMSFSYIPSTPSFSPFCLLLQGPQPHLKLCSPYVEIGLSKRFKRKRDDLLKFPSLYVYTCSAVCPIFVSWDLPWSFRPHLGLFQVLGIQCVSLFRVNTFGCSLLYTYSVFPYYCLPQSKQATRPALGYLCMP